MAMELDFRAVPFQWSMRLRSCGGLGDGSARRRRSRYSGGPHGNPNVKVRLPVIEQEIVPLRVNRDSHGVLRAFDCQLEAQSRSAANDLRKLILVHDARAQDVDRLVSGHDRLNMY